MRTKYDVGDTVYVRARVNEIVITERGSVAVPNGETPPPYQVRYELILIDGKERYYDEDQIRGDFDEDALVCNQ